MNKMSFSPSEVRVIEILKKTPGAKLTTAQLADRFYKRTDRPEYARVIIAGVVRSLVKKTGRSKDFKIKSSQRSGPHPIEVWIEGVH
jgi:RecA-family ATPase